MTETSTTQSKQPAAKPATAALPPEQWQFQVRLRRGEQGPELTRIVVAAADLLDLRAELWRDECLRKGRPDVPFEQIEFRLVPHMRGGTDGICDGFLLRARTPLGTLVEQQFGKAAFVDVALRTQQSLIKDKALDADETLSFDVAVAASPAAASGEEPLSVENKSRPLNYLSLPLPPLLRAARQVGDVDGVFPVIYTEEALGRAEQFARRGALLPAPIETGGVLIGPLASCPETGEFFAVICTVLEVQDAEQQQFSLSYSSKSWSRIQTIVRAMQAQPATRAYRILGQCHGHNFPPAGGAPPCDVCYTLKQCHRRSDSASVDDRLWSQAVFSCQPWHVCHIFGSDARKENVQSLYTLSSNRLESRGFYVVPKFDFDV